MEKLTAREKEFVALGAAIGCNCVPCISFHVELAKKVGISDDCIKEALLLAEKVKRVPVKQVMNTAKAVLKGEKADSNSVEDFQSDCCCSEYFSS